MEAIMKVLSRFKYILSVTMIFLLSGTVAYSYNINNTPEGGYLLCVNSKTKTVTFPNKLSCPAGFKSLELGAKGADGADGQSGKDLTQNAGYIITLKPQDVIASVASKSEKTLISKSGFIPGYYNLMSEVSMLFQSTNMQVVLCSLKTTGNSFSYSGFPSHEVANTWTGHTVQLSGVVYVASAADSISISCSFSGNVKVNYGHMGLTPIAPPKILVSD